MSRAAEKQKYPTLYFVNSRYSAKIARDAEGGREGNDMQGGGRGGGVCLLRNPKLTLLAEHQFS